MRTIIASSMRHSSPKVGLLQLEYDTCEQLLVVQEVLKVRSHAHNCNSYQSSWLLSSECGLA